MSKIELRSNEEISASCSPLEKSREKKRMLRGFVLLPDPTSTQPIVSLGVTRTSGFHRERIAIDEQIWPSRHVLRYFPSIFSIRKFTDFERVTRLSRKKTRSGNKSFKLGKRNYVERRWSFAGLIRGVKGIRKKQKLKGWG